MNLSFSTKLCIVACHSDTPFKKKIIQYNHPLLKKIAHTIYINSSRYDKTIPMIHTSKRDKYAKYESVLSTLNVQQYTMILWMTDEILLTFSLVPLIQIALQRGYHEYKDIIFQTPHYYLNPYPLSKINITPAQEDPSLFKSDTILAPIYSVSKEKEKEPDTFMLNGSYMTSVSIAPIHTISSEPTQEIDNTFILTGSYMSSSSILPVHSISNETPQDISKTFTLNGSYTPSATLTHVHSISNETPQDISKTFTLNGSYATSATITPVHSISKEPTQEIDNTFSLNGSYTPSATLTHVHSTPIEPTQETSNFKLLNSSYYPTKPVVTSHTVSQPSQELYSFKLLHSRYHPTKPVVTGRPSKSHIVPVTQKHVLSNTRISFTNILFSNKSKPRPKETKAHIIPVKETWMQQLFKLPQLPLRVDSMYETVLISFQPLPYIEYCLRKMILHLPMWSHTVVCGNLNTELITLWNLPINVISLDIDTINSEQYNELMLMPSFWELFHGETLLLYQEDSRPLEYSVNPFLHHIYGVLEPGITIRNKSSIIRYLETNPAEEGISEQIYFKHI